ncbi:plasmid mobilization relaxosome protein MobC [Vibrio mediterranei]|uniref:Relaxosome NikA n=1 Tax=Vibrio mediterranei TaxID=689 RepID=A0ABX5D9M8_9VIBR|nr:plasmid mobilization relaxosome protein MobC [Vibrio mediterranei]PCD85915.1 relaxosome NikA [Vibrio mediterranei]PRQ65366.1 relaxosome NikA [Vibrio mediterranei]
MKKEVSTVHVQAKLTPSEYEPFKQLIEITGLKKATLIKKVILSNKNNVFCVEKSKEEIESKKRMLFLANKASNNINQIAKRLNQAYRGEIVSERNYRQIMNDLVGVRATFEKGVDKC